jgi:hypothetical protein
MQHNLNDFADEKSLKKIPGARAWIWSKNRPIPDGLPDGLDFKRDADRPLLSGRPSFRILC